MAGQTTSEQGQASSTAPVYNDIIWSVKNKVISIIEIKQGNKTMSKLIP